MKTNSRKVRCVDTGEIFDSCREADRKYGWNNGTTWQIANMHGNVHSKRAEIAGHDFEFIEPDDQVDTPVFDPEVISFIYAKYSTKGQPVRCIETGEIFNSCREADRALGLYPGQTMHIVKGESINPPPFHFELVDKDELSADINPNCKEVFKPIPEFPNYSISNFGRVKNNRTGKFKCIVKDKKYSRVRCTVMLQNGVNPMSMSLQSLYKSAWEDEPIKFNDVTSSNDVHRSKKVYSITDGIEFPSYILCTAHYKFDYQKFREALHSSSSDTFFFRGIEFKLC